MANGPICTSTGSMAGEAIAKVMRCGPRALSAPGEKRPLYGRALPAASERNLPCRLSGFDVHDDGWPSRSPRSEPPHRRLSAPGPRGWVLEPSRASRVVAGRRSADDAGSARSDLDVDLHPLDAVDRRRPRDHAGPCQPDADRLPARLRPVPDDLRPDLRPFRPPAGSVRRP